MSARPLKCGRAETLAWLNRIAEALRNDPNPDMQRVANTAAALIEADRLADDKDDPRRHARRVSAILMAIGLAGRLDAPQARIRAAINGAESPAARREAARQALPGLRRFDDATVDRRIRAALS